MGCQNSRHNDRRYARRWSSISRNAVQVRLRQKFTLWLSYDSYGWATSENWSNEWGGGNDRPTRHERNRAKWRWGVAGGAPLRRPQQRRKKQHWKVPPVTRVRVLQRIRRWDGYLYNIDLFPYVEHRLLAFISWFRAAKLPYKSLTKRVCRVITERPKILDSTAD